MADLSVEALAGLEVENQRMLPQRAGMPEVDTHIAALGAPEWLRQRWGAAKHCRRMFLAATPSITTMVREMTEHLVDRLRQHRRVRSRKDSCLRRIAQRGNNPFIGPLFDRCGPRLQARDSAAPMGT